MYLKDRKTKMKDQSQFFLQFIANQTQKQKNSFGLDLNELNN